MSTRRITLDDETVVEHREQSNRLLLTRGHTEEMVSLRTPTGYFDGKTIVFRSLGLMFDGDQPRLRQIWETWKGDK